MGIDNRKIHEAFQNDVPVIVNTGSVPGKQLKAVFIWQIKEMLYC